MCVFLLSKVCLLNLRKERLAGEGLRDSIFCFWDPGLEVGFVHLSRPRVVPVGPGQTQGCRVPEQGGRKPRENGGDGQRLLGREVLFHN